MIYIIDAIKALDTNAQVSTVDEDLNSIVWHDENPNNITIEQIKNKQLELIEHYNSLEYARQRKEEYDSLNQLELLSDDVINGTTTYKDALLKIKTKWPKDNTGPIE